MTTKVLFAIAEMAPLIKVGGLADVGLALPKALRQIDVDVRVAVPYYSFAKPANPEKLDDVRDSAIWQTSVLDVPVYLVEHESSFGREQAYGYDDDLERFLAYCDILVEGADLMEWQPDVLHLNDWHPGFIASRVAAASDHPWAACGRIATIHNLAFTGDFGSAFAAEHDIAASDATMSALGQSVALADVVTTVSPTYAEEIRRNEHGHGLDDLFAEKGDRLRGILNGLDEDHFDPGTDPHLAQNFTTEEIDARATNKVALQKQVGLSVQDDLPLIGIVSRLFWQKGIDIAAEALGELLRERPTQVVALGQGDEENIEALKALADRYPDRVAVRFAFDEPLGQLIYGGCDVFLMPSRYEPCGIGQMIAMRYGAVPVVRRTGGLADSVSQFDAATQSGTGFLFDEPVAAAARSALSAALDAYENKPAWRALQLRCMEQHVSWRATAEAYADVYQQALDIRRHTASGVRS